MPATRLGVAQAGRCKDEVAEAGAFADWVARCKLRFREADSISERRIK
jgi:hypothetical protein